MLVLERAREGKRVVKARILTLHAVLIVADVGAGAYPTSSSLLGCHLGVHERPHAAVVQRVRLDQVDDIEAVRLASFSVADAEVVPLRVALGVVVGLENEIVLIFVDLDGAPQVTRLEARFEKQRIVVGSLWHIERRDLAFRCFTLLVRRRIDAIEDDTVHEVLLVSNTICLAPQGLLKNEFLRRIERFKIEAFFDVIRRILHVLHRCSSLHWDKHAGRIWQGLFSCIFVRRLVLI